jgi:cold shock CspA family protein
MNLDMKKAGTVKFFDVLKGYGFISPSDGSTDVFVHHSVIHAKGFRSLAQGESVEFDVEVNERNGKTQATNVTGPNGGFVVGAQRPDKDDNEDY